MTIAHIARRFVTQFGAALLALMIAFFAMEGIPGNPAEASGATSMANYETLQLTRDKLGLNRPLPERLLAFLLVPLTGNWGTSWASSQPVSDMLFDQAAATVKLALGASVIAGIAGFGIPTLVVLSPYPFWRIRMRELASTWSAIPLPVAGLLWVASLSIAIPIFPATGEGGFDHQVLPWLTLGLSLGGSIGVIVLQMYRQFHAETYYTAMRAKGLSQTRIILRHGTRFVLAHIVDLMYLQFGYALGGVVIVETMFARPGLGRVINTAIMNKDLPVIQAAVLISVLSYSLSMVAADVTASLLDPRLSAV